MGQETPRVERGGLQVVQQAAHVADGERNVLLGQTALAGNPDRVIEIDHAVVTDRICMSPSSTKTSE